VEVIMGRHFGWVFAVGLAIWITPTPAAAQVRVGVHTPNIGVSVAVGSPRVYVVDRHDDPYYRYRGRPYRPAPIVVVHERDRYRGKREREYRKDVREARREYERDLREARRDYEQDLRDARRDRRR
jgi:hypothetical protein